MRLIFCLLLVISLLFLNQNSIIEKFNASYQTFQSFIPINGYKYPLYPLITPSYSPYIPWFNGYTNLPWWNTSLGNKTNMSYDLRGDPLIIPQTDYVWNNSTNIPIYNNSI